MTDNYESTQEWIKKQYAKERQVGGTHYSKYNIQPIDFIMENDIPFAEANVIKYIVRHKDKNKQQDVIKALHYIEIILNNRYDMTLEDAIAEMNKHG